MSIPAIARHLNLVPASEPMPIMSLEQQEKWRTFIQASTSQDERSAALAQQQAAAEAEYENSFEGRTQHYREGEPPPASELRVKVLGLLPARAKLVRFYAWLDRERAELARLISARESFYDVVGVPQVAQAELDRIVASDNAGYL